MLHLLNTLKNLVRRNPFSGCTTTALLLASVLGAPAALLAQASGRGTIQGTVTDSSGAVIPGAHVTAVEVKTNVTRKQASTNSGFYAIASIDPGTYTVTVTAPGFKQFTQENITVDAIQVVGLNVTLNVGAGESITVTEAPVELNTANATLGATIENDTYKALPLALNNQPRDPTGFLALTPGVTGGGGLVNFNGGQANLNETYIEGVAMDDVNQQGDWGVVHSTFSVDAVDQFNAQTSSVSAGYQGVGSSNYVHKSGSNTFHGSAFEYFRNTYLDAWSFYSKGAINPVRGVAIKPAEHNNEFGGTIGGYIPHLRNKVFFFFSYDNTHFLNGVNPGYTTVPTLLERQGNFTELAAAGQPVYDPKSTICKTPTSCTRTRFSYNGVLDVIDPARISPISKYMESFLPAPSNSSLVNNYLGGFNTGFNYPRFSVKLDFDVIKNHRISVLGLEGGRYANPACCDSSGLPQPYLSTVGNTQNNITALVSDTWTISQRSVNRLAYAFNIGGFNGVGNTNPSEANPAWFASAAGITNIPAGQASDSFPRVNFSGPNSPLSWTTADAASHGAVMVFHLVDSFQTLRGRNSISAGAEYQWEEANGTGLETGTYLSLGYSNNETAGFNANSASLNTKTGGAYASFLIGAVDSAGITDNRAAQTLYARYRNFSPYIQDDIKVTKSLTVNIGLRWDIFSPFQEKQGRFSYLNPTEINPVTGTPGTLNFGGTGNSATYCNCTRVLPTWYKNLGPRFGFAYAINNKTVMRGGYSMSFTHGGGVGGRAGASTGPSQFGYTGGASPVSQGGITPAFYLDSTNTALPSYSLPSIDPSFGTGNTTTPNFTAAQGVTYVDPYLGRRAPYSQNWNFGFQRELFKATSISVDYAGSVGKFLSTGLGRPVFSNQLDPQYYVLGGLLGAAATPANVAAAQAKLPGFKLPYSNYSPTATLAQALRPFPQYNSVNDIWGNFGSSNYNSLQIQLTQRQRWGLNYGLAYTWAKTMDDTGGARSAFGINGAPASQVEYSLSQTVDIPNRVSVYAVYNSPFGKNGGNFLARQLVKGWALSTVVQHQAGLPLTIVATGCSSNTFSGTCMPSLNPNYHGNGRINGGFGRMNLAQGTTSIQYLDPNAFLPPPAYGFGNAPRTAPYGLRNPGNYSEDASLRRAFDIYERLKFTFEASAFNLDNHVDFGGPNATFNTQTPNSTLTAGQPASAFGTINSAGGARKLQFSARFDF